MNKNYSIIAFFPPLEDTKDIQERSIARIFTDQIHERDLYPTELVCMATLLTTTNTLFKALVLLRKVLSLHRLRHHTALCSEDQHAPQQSQQEAINDFSENEVPPDVPVAGLELPGYYSRRERPKT